MKHQKTSLSGTDIDTKGEPGAHSGQQWFSYDVPAWVARRYSQKLQGGRVGG
jgi:hypothetical protein